MSNENKIIIMKTIAFIVFTAILCLSIFACKKDKDKEPDTEQVCKEDKFSGTWEFTMNKDKVNEYKETVKLNWNGKTYIINDELSTRVDNASYIRYEIDFVSIDFWKDDCALKYKGSFDGKKL